MEASRLTRRTGEKNFSVRAGRRNWADAALVLPPDCGGWRATLLSAMADNRHSDSEPNTNETAGDSDIRERVETLKEKVSGLSEMLGEVEKTLEEER